MARSLNCLTGACGRCVDGSALRCSCSHHNHPSQFGSRPLAQVGPSPEKSAAVVDAGTLGRDNAQPDIEGRPDGEFRSSLGWTVGSTPPERFAPKASGQILPFPRCLP